jgi:flagellum-specific peptidoglycan hydrolase FlgJ
MNKNFPIVVRQALHSGLHKMQTYSKNTWVRLGFLGGLIFLISQKDFSFSISMGDKQALATTMATPQTNPRVQPASFIETATTPAPKVEKTAKPNTNTSPTNKKWWEEVRDNSANIQQKLNLANEATAVGDVLTDAEKATAAKLSNLSVVFSPGYFKKHNISDAVAAAKRKTCDDYINRYLKTAKEEADLFNIPVSITLAQGLLESNAGESALARKENNHFGIKCRAKCLGCRCANYTDDDRYDMFRIFESAWESFREHSKLLTGGRYKHLTKLDRSDYKNWSRGLKAAGYATDKKYADKLITIIVFFELDKFDR